MGEQRRERSNFVQKRSGLATHCGSSFVCLVCFVVTFSPSDLTSRQREHTFNQRFPHASPITPLRLAFVHPRRRLFQAREQWFGCRSCHAYSAAQNRNF